MIVFFAVALALLLVAFFSLVSAVRAATWSHWHNENERAPGRLGSPIRHGRAFWHGHENRWLAGWRWHLEWTVFKLGHPSLRLALGEGDDGGLSGHLAIGFAAIYFGLSTPLLRRLARRLLSPSGEGRHLRIALHDGALWIALWAKEWETSSRDPWYVRGIALHPIDRLLGEPRYSKRLIQATPALVPMPERAYRATISLTECTWQRPRWPFAKRLLRAEIDMDEGEQIPTPGKGENSWDGDEDATYGLSTRATTVPEAVAAMVETVLERRLRYGGPRWKPQAKPPVPANPDPRA